MPVKSSSSVAAFHSCSVETLSVPWEPARAPSNRTLRLPRLPYRPWLFNMTRAMTKWMLPIWNAWPS
jgi:hypothetical protein